MIQPIFDDWQRDGRNKDGLQMFKCLKCNRRSSWYKRFHPHPALEGGETEEKVTEGLTETPE